MTKNRFHFSSIFSNQRTGQWLKKQSHAKPTSSSAKNVTAHDTPSQPMRHPLLDRYVLIKTMHKDILSKANTAALGNRFTILDNPANLIHDFERLITRLDKTIDRAIDETAVDPQNLFSQFRIKPWGASKEYCSLPTVGRYLEHLIQSHQTLSDIDHTPYIVDLIDSSMNQPQADKGEDKKDLLNIARLKNN